jgi:hypothetical protein
MMTIGDFARTKVENLLERRYEKFRSLGEYVETSRKAARAAS